MKKYFVSMLTLLFCLILMFPAGAQTLTGDKQALVNKINLEGQQLQTQTQFTETAQGSAEYRITRLDGTLLMMTKELANIQGAKLNLDYQINSPAQQLGFKWKLSYNGKDYQGDVFLSGSQIIFTKDLLQLIKDINPAQDVPDPKSVPQYIYVDDPELANMWRAMLDSTKVQQMVPRLTNLIAFIVEAMPDKSVRVSGDKITLQLGQQDLKDAILSLTAKIKAEPDRFATLLAEYVTTVDATQSFAETKAQILRDLQDSIKNGEFPPTVEQIDQFFKETGLTLESLSYTMPEGTNGAGTFNLSLRFDDQKNVAGHINMVTEQTRNGDKLDGKLSLDVKVNIKDQGMDVGASMSGTYSQSKTSAASDSSLQVNVLSGQLPLLNIGLNVLSKANVDKNVKVDVPTLTPANSVDLKSLMPEDKVEAKGLLPIPGREQPVNVVLNGQPIGFDVQPFVQDKRTMVPVRNLAQALGGHVYFTNNNEVHIIKGNKNIVMFIGEDKYIVNGITRQMDVPVSVKAGRTMVPLRFVAEELGCQIGLADDTVYLRTK